MGSCVRCVLPSFTLLLMIFSSVGVYAEAPTILKVVPEPIGLVVKEGQDFQVHVDVYNAVDMMSFQFKISWDPQCVEYVSHVVYPPWQPPVIILPPAINQTEGYIIIAATTNGGLAFAGSATLATIMFHALKSGNTSISISEPQIYPDPIIPETENASITILPSITWASMTGKITSYGPDMAYGLINVFAVIKNRADGWFVFTVPPMGPIRIQIFPPPPINFTLYIARIVNASTVELNHNESDFLISGFWAVSNITKPTSAKDVLGLLHSTTIASGELSVTDNWTHFTINIEGLETIQGNVTSHRIRQIGDTNTKIPYCDTNHDGKIDVRDIAQVAVAYGSTLGFDRYEFNADSNSDLRIDARDVALCSSLYGKTF